MDKETLILKWLDGELNEAELAAFKQLEDYSSYVKLYDNAPYFKSPLVDKAHHYANIKAVTAKLSPPKTTTNRLRTAIRIAAVFVMAFGIYFTFFNQDMTKVNTMASENTTISLPDASEVIINALSSIRYDDEEWEQKRKVYLEGEAFFKVAKGAKFEVSTQVGSVLVLGTRFNVKQRGDFFEVKCFEGLVSVTVKNNEELKLRPGETVKVLNGKLEKATTSLLAPTWIHGKSSFESAPFGEVLNELTRQYDIEVQTEGVDMDKLFTGSFVHNNKELAIKSITQPFKLSYDLGEKKVKIFKHE